MSAFGRHVTESLAYYRDLESDERTAVDAHLAGCEACRATLEAYRLQDAALAALPTIAPTREWTAASDRASTLERRLRSTRAGQAGPATRLGAIWESGTRLLGEIANQFPSLDGRWRRRFAHFGDALALAGVLVLLVAFVWQLRSAQDIVTSAPPGSLVPPASAIHPPLTQVALPSPWLPALPWLGSALLAVGGLFVLSRKSLAATLAGAALAGLLLVTFVPPLSAIPNPAGVVWRLAGGYGYDPALPFRNAFLILGHPDRTVRSHLDELIGERGLAPLDPVQPLSSYQILRVGLHPRQRSTALITTRFTYADGTSRVYQVPLLNPAIDVGGFWLAEWRDEGLERLFSYHLQLDGLPLATRDSPIRLTDIHLLDLHPAVRRLDNGNPSHWLWNSARVQQLVWAPDGHAFLATVEVGPALRQLWRVPLDGRPPTAVAPAGDLRDYGWSPDSRVVIYTRRDPDAQAVDPRRPYAIMAVPVSDLDANPPVLGNSPLVPYAPRAVPLALATALASDKLPGLTPEGAWFFANDALWIAPFDGHPAKLVLADPSPQPLDLAPWPSPDGTRLAFVCGGQLCLLRRDGQPLAPPVPISPAEASWSADGTQLAVVDRDPNDLRPVKLVVLDTDGKSRMSQIVAPNDVTETPQWTPDGRTIFLQTYPFRGRRIIAVDVPGGTVLDLSREHWDTYFALAPDGRSLLVNNGRGDYWRVELRIEATDTRMATERAR